MISTPVLDATAVPGPAKTTCRLTLALCGLAGFSGLLAVQAIGKYYQALAGVTTAAFSAMFFVALAGFAAGAIAAAQRLRQQPDAKPLQLFGLSQLATGLLCLAFSYGCRPELALVIAILLALPATACMGSGFAFAAAALDRKHWPQAYAASLGGALLAAVATPVLLMPAAGLRGAMWICCAIGIASGAIAYWPKTAARRPVQPQTPLAELRHPLAVAFAAGGIVFLLNVIWIHIAGVTLGSGVYASAWTLTAILFGLLLGAVFVCSGRRAHLSTLFQCAALLLMVQFGLWDRVPGFFNFTPPLFARDSSWLSEGFKLYVAIMLLSPTAAVLGVIYPRLLASPGGPAGSGGSFAGYVSAANALGGLFGALLGSLLLIPLAGSEVTLKAIIVGLGLLWAKLLLRETPTRRRLAGAALVAVVLLTVTLGRWWNWAWLTAGMANSFGQVRVVTTAPADGVRYLPAAFVFQHEDTQGGFTTVVEQTMIAGEVGHTVRSLFANGVFQADDNPTDERLAPFGVCAAPSLFVKDYGRALLIGLGAGRTVAAWRRLGYREIAVAEPSRGTVEAAGKYFAGVNEAVLADSRVRVYGEDGRKLLASSDAQYDLIAVEAYGPNLESEEFYRLARARLRAGGVLEQSLHWQHAALREIASQLATARAEFPYAELWQFGDRGMLLAADHPLTDAQFQPVAGQSPEDSARLIAALTSGRLLNAGGVERLLRDIQPPVNTDSNRWLEYAGPHSQITGGLLERLLQFR